MMTVAATAATRISAMKTIIAPMPIAAMVSCSCVLLFFMFVFFMVLTSNDDVLDTGVASVLSSS